MGAITVQAGAGRMAVAAGAAEDATRTLQAIEGTARVVRDVRWMVGLLGEESGRRRAVPPRPVPHSKTDGWRRIVLAG